MFPSLTVHFHLTKKDATDPKTLYLVHYNLFLITFCQSNFHLLLKDNENCFVKYEKLKNCEKVILIYMI